MTAMPHATETSTAVVSGRTNSGTAKLSAKTNFVVNVETVADQTVLTTASDAPAVDGEVRELRVRAGEVRDAASGDAGP